VKNSSKAYKNLLFKDSYGYAGSYGYGGGLYG
jgi:hypothetical protein